MARQPGKHHLGMILLCVGVVADVVRVGKDALCLMMKCSACSRVHSVHLCWKFTCV